MTVALVFLAATLFLGGLLLLAFGLAVLGLLEWRDRRASARRRAGRAARLAALPGFTDEDHLGDALPEGCALSEVEGLPYLQVTGSAYARGVAHGHLLRNQVRRQIADFLPRLARDACTRTASWVLQGAAESPPSPATVALSRLLDVPYLRDKIRDDLLDRAASHLEWFTRSHHLEEMAGVADGADIDPQLVRRFHAVSEVASAGCANLAAWGEATRGGDFLQLRNLDWPLELGVQAYPLLLEHAPGDGRSGHLTAGFAAFVGALQGGNEHGLALGEVGAGSCAVSYRGEPMAFRLRRVMEEARDLDQAGAILEGPRRTKGYNFVIGSLRERRAAAWEVNRERAVRFDADDPREHACGYARPARDAVLRGEPALDPEVRRRQRGADGPGDPRGSWSYRYRYALLADHLEAAGGALDEAAMLEMARAAGRRSQNLVSVLYTRAGMRVAYAAGDTRACDRRYADVAWPWS